MGDHFSGLPCNHNYGYSFQSLLIQASRYNLTFLFELAKNSKSKFALANLIKVAKIMKTSKNPTFYTIGDNLIFEAKQTLKNNRHENTK